MVIEKLRVTLAKFRTYWQYYVFQSLAATVALFALMMIINIQEKPVIIASIGATTFIVFTMPGYLTAKPRNVIGGHIIGMLCGFIASAAIIIMGNPSAITLAMILSLAVGLSIFIMVVLDMEHPPASGTALGVALHGISVTVTLTILISILFLSLVHKLFRHRLRDLT